MKIYRIVETDNHDGDYPNETFVNLPYGHKTQMDRIANEINKVFCYSDNCSRYWKVVPFDYELKPGFEP